MILITPKSQNYDNILKHSKILLQNVSDVVLQGSSQLCEVLSENEPVSKKIAKIVASSGNITNKQMHEVARKIGEPLGELTTDVVTAVEQSESTIPKKILNIAKKYKVDPNTVVNGYLKNSIEEGIDKISADTEEIKDTIIKETIKNKVKNTIKKFSLFNYIKNLFIKIKNFILNKS